MAIVSGLLFFVIYQRAYHVKMLGVTELTKSIFGKCRHFFLFYNSQKLKFATSCKKMSFFDTIGEK